MASTAEPFQRSLIPRRRAIPALLLAFFFGHSPTQTLQMNSRRRSDAPVTM